MEPRILIEIRASVQIVIIGAVLANMFISYVRAMPGSGQRSKIRRNQQKRKNRVLPDCVYWVFLSSFAWLSDEKLEKKQDGSVSTALLEALVVRFVWFGENYINPQPIQAGRIGGPGRG